MSKRLLILSTILAACGFLAAAALGFPGRSGAQGAPLEVLLSWRADSYVPSRFSGKALPASESRITAGVDLVDQGQRVDLSGQRVQWYVNNEFYQGGTGMTRITLQAPRFIGTTSIQLRVSIPDYGRGPGKTVIIPVVPPEVVIGSSAPSLSADETPFALEAVPYFFNVGDPSGLQFSWALSGRVVGTSNPFTVTERMAEDARAARLELRVSNPERALERITENLTLFPIR